MFRPHAMLCAAGPWCRFKPRCRFFHPEGWNDHISSQLLEFRRRQDRRLEQEVNLGKRKERGSVEKSLAQSQTNYKADIVIMKEKETKKVTSKAIENQDLHNWSDMVEKDEEDLANIQNKEELPRNLPPTLLKEVCPFGNTGQNGTLEKNSKCNMHMKTSREETTTEMDPNVNVEPKYTPKVYSNAVGRMMSSMGWRGGGLGRRGQGRLEPVQERGQRGRWGLVSEEERRLREEEEMRKEEDEAARMEEEKAGALAKKEDKLRLKREKNKQKRQSKKMEKKQTMYTKTVRYTWEELEDIIDGLTNRLKVEPECEPEEDVETNEVILSSLNKETEIITIKENKPSDKSKHNPDPNSWLASNLAGMFDRKTR